MGLLRVQIYRWVVLCLLDSNGGMRVARVWRLHKTYKTYKTYKIMVRAPVFALTGYAAASRGCGAAVCYGSGADLPLGSVLLA